MNNVFDTEIKRIEKEINDLKYAAKKTSAAIATDMQTVAISPKFYLEQDTFGFSYTDIEITFASSEAKFVVGYLSSLDDLTKMTDFSLQFFITSANKAEGQLFMLTSDATQVQRIRQGEQTITTFNLILVSTSKITNVKITNANP